ncbi:MAG TPA: hypothetical protein VF940_08810 [Streptosporangiaceae bacterium]
MAITNDEIIRSMGRTASMEVLEVGTIAVSEDQPSALKVPAGSEALRVAML